MNKNYATISASKAIDILLDRGAEKLYDKYLQQKLPNHASHLNDQQVQANIKTLSIKQPQKQSIERVTLEMAKTIPVDSLATKRVKHEFKQTSIFSPKNTTIDKSTKYQTVIQSQQMINQSFDQSKDLEQSLLLQEESYRRENIFHRSQRPSTMQVPRSSLRDRDNHDILRENKLEQIEEKRASTCHVRKRKSFASLQAQKKKLIRLRQDRGNLLFPQQIELQKNVRAEKEERTEKQLITERQKSMEVAKIRMKDIRTIQNYEQLKQKLRGKSKAPIPVTNFQNQTGKIVINGRSRVPQTHIIQLSFNPEQTNVYHTLEPRHSNVHPTKTKSFFSSKLKKKLKLSNQEFTNNGSRQISSIPFIALNYGILLSEAGLQASASRRRPVEQVTRKQYIEETFNSKFKSHIPIVNSARLKLSNAFEGEELTARSSVQPMVSVQKNMETTNESKIQMQKSLLWKPRGKSLGKEIKISNKHILQQQILEFKLGLPC